ncbi:tRNA (guanine-N1)-methyltransferase [Sphaeroforma arctica JP610]|uniref:tRNA (guanine(9)-N(1))-methyltransferase n=1 Tax=Sphaeroforma arctica JP610 TaxID=667725 RepID=A0A0L0F6B4_9EUKA|nr:tRNA (guanine-N1)-methyltransferase [Sphaeroforma arctica JP610]KNC72265.1 tRNA (guanine-N1)-methyltransferase [Sphaeroforma arctica JP610]|eukprot:XP_014146167.1 tRNA (guanine-N1)-methyltransferase [Sphaeroforma arctica JP610]
MHAEFLEERKRKRKQVKERRKEKYKEMTEEEKAAHRLPKWIRMADGCKQRIVVDMGWDKEMNAKELTNAVTQVNRCYSINRRATPPVQLYITDNSEHTCSVFDKSAPDYKRWDVRFVRMI